MLVGPLQIVDKSVSSESELIITASRRQLRLLCQQLVDRVKFVLCNTIPNVLPFLKLQTRGISSQAGIVS